MRRHPIDPRPGWRDTVSQQGLVFPTTPLVDAEGRATGEDVVYWNESACYELAMSQVLELESATEELYRMCLHAARVLSERYTDADLMLPEGALALARDSRLRAEPSIYARFDLAYDGTGPAKMLEINGDTPTGLVETAVAQWLWLEEVFPGRDQWNSVHDRLVAWWSQHTSDFPGRRLHFFHSAADSSGEEEMTTTYLRDTAAMAGLETFGHVIEEVGWDVGARRFVDSHDLPITAAFKLYPWENMLAEEFGPHVLQRREVTPVRWLEPAWKMLLSTKAILPILWELYPGHPNLLPAYLGDPGPLDEWVAKPIWGREGDNIVIHTAGVDEAHPGAYDGQPLVYQQWHPIPDFDGHRVVLGSWVIGGAAAGCLVRESDGPITDYYSRVVPHVITDAAAPDDEQIRAWLEE